MAPKTDLNEHDEDMLVSDENPHVGEFTLRLRELVKRSGGSTAVAKRSKVPIKTLANYLAGREMRRPELVAVAAACNVSLEWLATGNDPAAPAASTAAPTPASVEPPRLISMVDLPRMGSAIDIVLDVIHRSGRRYSSAHRARMIVLSYDVLGEPDDPDDPRPPIDEDDMPVDD
jgi:hypothetical protein